MKNISFIVSTRPGYREEELSSKLLYYREKYGTYTIRLASLMPDISSTDVRERLAKGSCVSDMVPAAVERYIRENGLYK